MMTEIDYMYSVAYVLKNSTDFYYKSNIYLADASELEFPPGVWPRDIRFKDGAEFRRDEVNEEMVKYRMRRNGLVSLTVFND